MNERYLIYLKTTNYPNNYDYMSFIDEMKKLYLEYNEITGDNIVVNGHISDHEDFTKFIRKYIEYKY